MVAPDPCNQFDGNLLFLHGNVHRNSLPKLGFCIFIAVKHYWSCTFLINLIRLKSVFAVFYYCFTFDSCVFHSNVFYYSPKMQIFTAFLYNRLQRSVWQAYVRKTSTFKRCFVWVLIEHLNLSPLKGILHAISIFMFGKCWFFARLNWPIKKGSLLQRRGSSSAFGKAENFIPSQP